jgi:hypothetical protein
LTETPLDEQNAKMRTITLLLLSFSVCQLASAQNKAHGGAASEGKFVSMAKLVVQGQIKIEPVPGAPFLQEYEGDLHGTIMETLESAELRRRALDRVRNLHPNLNEGPVRIECDRTIGSAIIQLRAFGDDPKYTTAFLDAHMDEFIAFRASMRHGISHKAINALAEDLVRREKTLTAKFEKMVEFSRPFTAALLPAETQRLVQRIIKMRGLRDELEWQIKTGVNTTEATKQAELAAKEIETTEAKLKEVSRVLDTWRQYKADYEGEMKERDDLLSAIRKFQLDCELANDPVTVMERASRAVARTE